VRRGAGLTLSLVTTVLLGSRAFGIEVLDPVIFDAVAFFTFHEAYHVGALGAIRKAMGLPGPAELVMARMDG